MTSNKLLVSLLLISNISQGSYLMHIPVEKSSISFTNGWNAAETLYTEWVDDGKPGNCQSWVPDRITYEMNKAFTQNGSDCTQQQVRTVQKQETLNGEIRPSGSPYEETQFIDVPTATRDTTGTFKYTWTDYAARQGLVANWNSLAWRNKGLTYTPNGPYPVSSMTGDLILARNQITEIDGLNGLTSVTGNISAGTNKISDISGLSALKTVGGSLYLDTNNITHVNALINLTYVGINLHLQFNPVEDINGLQNVVVGGLVAVDATYNGPKLSASSRFCQMNDAAKFSYATKDQLCEG